MQRLMIVLNDLPIPLAEQYQRCCSCMTIITILIANKMEVLHLIYYDMPIVPRWL